MAPFFVFNLDNFFSISRIFVYVCRGFFVYVDTFLSFFSFPITKNFLPSWRNFGLSANPFSLIWNFFSRLFTSVWRNMRLDTFFLEYATDFCTKKKSVKSMKILRYTKRLTEDFFSSLVCFFVSSKTELLSGKLSLQFVVFQKKKRES